MVMVVAPGLAREREVNVPVPSVDTVMVAVLPVELLAPVRSYVTV